MTTSTFSEEGGRRSGRPGSVVRVTGVALDADDVLAEHATVRVDLLDRELNPANSGGPRKANEPVCGSSAERQHAVTFTGTLDRDVLEDRRRAFARTSTRVWVMSMRLLLPIFSRP